MKYVLKQYVKTFLQNVVLPLVYKVYSLQKINEKRILLADAHHDDVPFSMEYLAKTLENSEYKVVTCFLDYGQASFGKIVRNMFFFMKYYATTKYTFICDYYLPASSCEKRQGTKLIQLWHACGALKKFGYSTKDDISEHYKGNPFANYDIFTVSSAKCIKPFQDAIRDTGQIVQDIGVSRTDCYFDTSYKTEILKKFYKYYPEAMGKKVILWAPTFRGDAGDPQLCGRADMQALEKELGDDYFCIWSLHPHAAKRFQSEVKMKTEELIVAADVLITDYSSIVFEFCLLRKSIVLFVSDIEEYRETRGFYMPLEEIPALIVQNGKELINAVTGIEGKIKEENIRKFNLTYMNRCDGKATERLLEKLQIKEDLING